MQFTIGVGVNNNHFRNTGTKKCNELNVGGVLNFLDEGGGVLKIKVLRLGRL